MVKNPLVTIDPWHPLREATSARIALGRAGGSLPAQEWLRFKSAHAAARDAVHNHFDAERLASEIRGLNLEVIIVDSTAANRLTFLQRPDLGRQLDERSRYALQQAAGADTPPDLVVIVSDGLSPLAVERHAPPLLAALAPRLSAANWRFAPVVVARFGRVALQDEIGQVLAARLALTLIGERPGLGTPDSMGAYLVYAPRAGNSDANRNCVSNIRPEGLSYEAAADTLFYLLSEARRRQISGVQLKDERAVAGSQPPRALRENR
jgi:ethanolamine ammonia-lyase small subunit